LGDCCQPWQPTKIKTNPFARFGFIFLRSQLFRAVTDPISKPEIWVIRYQKQVFIDGSKEVRGWPANFFSWTS
jgi:hypothetical protein